MRVTQIWCYFCQWRISDEKTLDKLKLRLLVQNDWPVTFKRVKGMEVKNRSRNCSRYMITNATHGSEWNLFVIRDIIWTGETRIGSEDRHQHPDFNGYVVIMQETVLVYKKCILKFLGETDGTSPWQLIIKWFWSKINSQYYTWNFSKIWSHSGSHRLF